MDKIQKPRNAELLDIGRSMYHFSQYIYIPTNVYILECIYIAELLVTIHSSVFLFTSPHMRNTKLYLLHILWIIKDTILHICMLL